jgi:hypothetical protein
LKLKEPQMWLTNPVFISKAHQQKMM